MDDPEVPSPDGGGEAAPPTMTQDQAVIGWLATRPALPSLTRELLIDVLIVLKPLSPTDDHQPAQGRDGRRRW